jgi:hypothetical protein
MMWDVAAGVIIGGAVLAMVAQGIGFYTYSAKVGWPHQAGYKAFGALIVFVGLCAALWVIFFKAGQQIM